VNDGLWDDVSSSAEEEETRKRIRPAMNSGGRDEEKTRLAKLT